MPPIHNLAQLRSAVNDVRTSVSDDAKAQHAQRVADALPRLAHTVMNSAHHELGEMKLRATLGALRGGGPMQSMAQKFPVLNAACDRAARILDGHSDGPDFAPATGPVERPETPAQMHSITTFERQSPDHYAFHTLETQSRVNIEQPTTRGIGLRPSVPGPALPPKPAPYRREASPIRSQEPNQPYTPRVTQQYREQAPATEPLRGPTPPPIRPFSPPKPPRRQNAMRANHEIAQRVRARLSAKADPAAQMPVQAPIESPGTAAPRRAREATAAPLVSANAMPFGDDDVTFSAQDMMSAAEMNRPPLPTWTVKKVDPRRFEGMNLPLVQDKRGKMVPLRFSEITTQSGERMWLTNGMAAGNFGVFHYAIKESGEIVALKKFRMEKKSPSQIRDDENGQPMQHTEVTDRGDFDNEMYLQGAVSQLEFGAFGKKAFAVMPLGRPIDSAMEAFHGDRNIAGMWVLGQLAESLGKVHDLGYVHLDVKLPNALADNRGRVSIGDMGLATPLNHKGELRLGEPTGTAGFMAPEVRNMGTITAKADVWSLGASISEVHVPWWLNPFTGNHSQQDYKDYHDWHERLAQQNGGVIALNQLVPPGTYGETKWDHYFNKLAQADPDMAEYVLNKMMNPDPDKRDNMADVMTFAQRRTPHPASQEAFNMRAAWADVESKDTNRINALGGLEFFSGLVKSGRFVM